MPPLTHPTVTIGSQIYTLKATGLYSYLLDQWGVNMATLVEQINTPGPGRFSLIVKLFAALVAHTYVERGKPVLTPEQWALKLEADHVEFDEVIKAVMAAAFTKKTQPVEPASQTQPAPSAEAPIQ